MSDRSNAFPTKARATLLCALSQKKLRQAAAFLLESRLAGVRVTETGSVGETLEILLGGDSFDAVILQHPEGSDAICKLLRALKSTLPIYVLVTAQSTDGIDPSGLNIAGTFQGTDMIDDLAAAVDRHLADRLDEGALPGDASGEFEADADRFVRIRVELIDRKIPLGSDLFIRLGATKFLKLFNRGDSFDREDSYRYLIEKNVPFLYVERRAAGMVVDQLNERFKRLLAAEKPAELDSGFATSVHEVAVEIITRSGLTPEVQTLIKNNVMLVVKSMASRPRMKAILDRIAVDRTKYISSHSVALAQLSCSIAAGMDWGSSSTFHKLTLAAFMHDIDVQSQDLAQLQTKAELGEQSSTFGRDELKAYTLHPSRGADLAKSLEEVPPDVDTIIAQHHERPDGSGFPRGLTNAQIHPLASLFIVSHDVLTEVFRKGEAFSMDDFVKDHAELYSQGNFKQVMKALKSSTSKIESATS